MTIALVTLVTAGCAGNPRPDRAAWDPLWDEVRALIPDEASLGSPPDEATCRQTLAALRERNPDLLPTPILVADDLVSDWVAVAEGAFFKCPPAGPEIDSFEEAYRELDRLEESITEALEG